MSLRPRCGTRASLGGLILAALLLLTPAASAQTTPEHVVSSLANATMDAIADAGATESDAIGTVADLVKAAFDLPTLAQFTLGEYWQDISTGQRAAFQDAFGRHIAVTTIRRFRDFERAPLQHLGSRSVGDTDTLLGTQATRRDGSTARLVWRLRPADDGWRVVDIVLDGVSLSLTSRDEFTAFLRRHDGEVAALTDALASGGLAGG